MTGRILLLLTLLIISGTVTAFSSAPRRRKRRTLELHQPAGVRRPAVTKTTQVWARQPPDNPPEVISRRKWFTTTTAAATVVTFGSFRPRPALAKEEEAFDAAAAQQAFDAVRQQVSPGGGVAYLQEKVDAADFPALLEFTKTYDQVLRKGAMGRAKKFLSPEKKEKATALANAVTFDLIGINRSARPGQESAAKAAQYLQELKDDVQAFLELEPKYE